MRFGGNAAHALHAIQHKAFGFQNALHIALNLKRDIARFDHCPVVQVYAELEIGINDVKDLCGQFNTG